MKNISQYYGEIAHIVRNACRSPTHPNCGKCGDTGAYLDESGRAMRCVCQRADLAARIVASLRLPEGFGNCSTSNYVCSTRYQQEAAQAARRTIEAPGPKAGLVFYGPNGTGKTHLACAVACGLADKGLSLRYVPALSFGHVDFDRVRKEQARAAGGQGFILDDLGQERDTDYVRGNIKEILHHAYDKGQLIVITTNLSPGEIGRRYGGSIESRLSERCTAVNVTGPDARKGG